MIRVIGLGGTHRSDEWSERLRGQTVVARSVEQARRVLPDRVAIDHGYDHEFDRPDVQSIAEAVVGDLTARASSGTPVTYLVPGSGAVADATVAELCRAGEVELVPGTTTAPGPGGRVHLVDALEIAAAEASYPFDSGLVPLDPTATTVITNWCGAHVTDLAARRIRRQVPCQDELAPNTAAELILEPVEPWEACRTLPALQRIASRLRRPDGCPWDREQTVETMLPHLIAELDELREAIEDGDHENQREEMGDLLMNLVLCAQIAHEQGRFEMSDVLAGIGEKMIRRHPHVFGEIEVASVDEVFANWQRIKEQEKSGDSR